MKQEQKPFEIMEPDLLEAICRPVTVYVEAANAEIRRLQRVNRLLGDDKRGINVCYQQLKQQLADAPTWGEWVDATTRALVSMPDGVYELENSSSFRCLAYRQRDRDNPWIDLTYNPGKGITRFRRLNYEPKPAREVEPPEKKYNLLGYHVTVAEMAEWRGNPDLNKPNIGELARDFLAVQAELRELKGER